MGRVEQAYNALRIASERMGRNNFRAGLYSVRRDHRGRVTQGYSVTPEHAAVVDAMPRVLSGELSPSDAMAMLHEYNTEKQRLGA